MRCINKYLKAAAAVFVCCIILSGCGGTKIDQAYNSQDPVFGISSGLEYERAGGLADGLCVTVDDVKKEGVDATNAEAAALFDITQQEVVYSKNVHEKLYPASTTKILTALIALKYTSLDEEVVLGNSVTGFQADEATCGFQPGDVVTMEDLLYGLLIQSGNDAAAAIAVHISGSADGFAAKMNEEALAIGATNSHFMNPHGLHKEDHYTTAYDLYLIFQEAIQYEDFRKIIHIDSYTAEFKGADGTDKSLTFEPTNLYLKNEARIPDGVAVIGGKTGTTKAAGSCLVLLSQDQNGNDYISIILKADNRTLLYKNMSDLIDQIQK